ncbi:hypothetical protein EVAR_5729_1 [Eumeta japonica]|uniref:Uncharacterized protein n=1 Tax=Eumeta variegata TaxID=151549 RepID=A0A4C1T523_EUMVA|nr:hypothetical protein EVAR_5729_1 [Eumeta japonica]
MRLHAFRVIKYLECFPAILELSRAFEDTSVKLCIVCVCSLACSDEVAGIIYYTPSDGRGTERMLCFDRVHFKVPNETRIMSNGMVRSAFDSAKRSRWIVLRNGRRYEAFR